MAFLFNKFQQAVKTLAKSPIFARDPRHLQFEADINRIFLYTSYNRLGKDADEADAEEIIEMASKASLGDQQKQVQENIHSQVKTFCMLMDEIFLPEKKNSQVPVESSSRINGAPRHSGLSFAVGGSGDSTCAAVPETNPLKLTEVSRILKEHQLGYSLSLRISQIQHKDAGLGLFLEGEADVGAVVAIYPGVIYSPAYYRFISGYPRIDVHNSYLITRYDGTVINAQPWGTGSDTRELWDGTNGPEVSPATRENPETGSDRLLKILIKPPENSRGGSRGEVLERRNPLAFAHFANHPAKGTLPNVMVCPYDFPLAEMDMRSYIPNVAFGDDEGVKVRRFGSFWFKSRGSTESSPDSRSLKTVVLVATRAICDEEIFLNYRLSNSKRWPEWYTPVDEEEDKRRWG